MPRKLKVYRTSAGFHDAYVAAPSQKSALAAWGSDVNLFARGMAEEVKDDALIREPLAKPGEVVMVSRGDLAAHLNGMKRPRATNKPAKGRARVQQPKRPPPSRQKLDEAEEELSAAKSNFAHQIGELERLRDQAERNLDRLCSQADKALSRLRQRRAAAHKAYQAALDKWSE
ncbi:hypothetical protein ACWPMX_14345 [Tsuneonella sp. HG094]